MADDFNFDPFDDEQGSTRQRVSGLVRDVIRKTVSQGAEARHLTEETLRNIVGEVKLPREIAALVLQQADQVKSEVVRVVAGEVRTFLEEANIADEIARILTTLSFEIRTEIRFIPNDEKLKTSVKSRVGLKSQAAAGKELLDDEESRIIERVIRRGVSNVLGSRIIARVLGGEDGEDEDDAGAEATPPKRARAAGASAGKAQGAGGTASPRPKATVARTKSASSTKAASSKPKTRSAKTREDADGSSAAGTRSGGSKQS